jgi:glutamyl-tRNA reductase
VTLLVLGLSHHKAPVELLELVAVDQSSAAALEGAALAGEHVREAMALSTCNRTELYAEAVTFHGALADLTAAFTTVTGVPMEQLQPYFYVHYEERGVAHTFSVVSGLDSMAIGEAQILGQFRSALARAQDDGHIGSTLNPLFQQALRVGKRVHTESGIDEVSHSLVDVGLERAESELGDLSARSVLVVGAGGMGALAATSARRRGVGSLSVANRGLDRGRSLAQRLDADHVAWDELESALPEADVVIASTGARGLVLDRALVERVQARRSGRPQVYVDLALPRDIDPEVAALPGVTLVGLAGLGAALAAAGTAPQTKVAADLVTAEVAEFLLARAADTVVPTVSALRRRAETVVASELERLGRRNPSLTDAQRHEVDRAVRRVVDKLLHVPTVRAKQLAAGEDGLNYARVLRELFDLDPRDVTLVAEPVPPIVPTDLAAPMTDDHWGAHS